MTTGIFAQVLPEAPTGTAPVAPVTINPSLDGIMNSFRSLEKATAAPKSTQADRDNEALKPLARRLAQIDKMGSTPRRRGMIMEAFKNFTHKNPRLHGAAKGLVDSYFGVDTSKSLDPHLMMFKQLHAQASDPKNFYLYKGAITFNDDGSPDMGKTYEKFGSAIAKQQAFDQEYKNKVTRANGIKADLETKNTVLQGAAEDFMRNKRKEVAAMATTMLDGVKKGVIDAKDPKAIQEMKANIDREIAGLKARFTADSDGNTFVKMDEILAPLVAVKDLLDTDIKDFGRVRSALTDKSMARFEAIFEKSYGIHFNALGPEGQKVMGLLLANILKSGDKNRLENFLEALRTESGVKTATKTTADVTAPSLPTSPAATPVTKADVDTTVGWEELNITKILDGDHIKLVEKLPPAERRVGLRAWMSAMKDFKVADLKDGDVEEMTGNFLKATAFIAHDSVKSGSTFLATEVFNKSTMEFINHIKKDPKYASHYGKIQAMAGWLYKKELNQDKGKLDGFLRRNREFAAAFRYKTTDDGKIDLVIKPELIGSTIKETRNAGRFLNSIKNNPRLRDEIRRSGGELWSGSGPITFKMVDDAAMAWYQLESRMASGAVAAMGRPPRGSEMAQIRDALKEVNSTRTGFKTNFRELHDLKEVKTSVDKTFNTENRATPTIHLSSKEELDAFRKEGTPGTYHIVLNPGTEDEVSQTYILDNAGNLEAK